MATRTTTSSTTTTRTLIQEPLGGKSVVRYDNVTTSQERKKTLKERQLGQGGLSSLFRVELILITILSISVGSALTEFDTLDLIETTPNYQVVNDFVSIDDPLNTINYIVYGEEVFDNVVSFVRTFSDLGIVAKNYWDGLVGITELLPVQFTLNFNKLNSLVNAQAYYEDLTNEQQDKWEEVYNTLTFLFDWFYYSPAELTA
jgi:hypothetical protein